MPRKGLTDAVKLALAAPHVVSFFMVDMDLEAGHFRACTAAYSFTWDGELWLGIAYIGKLEAIKEAASPEAQGFSFEMSGIPSENMATILAENYQGRPCTVYKTLLDPDTYQIIPDPFIVQRGKIDTMDVPELGKKGIIKVSVLDRRASWDRPRIIRYTNADQQLRHPGDTGLAFVEDMVDVELTWGDFSPD